MNGLTRTQPRERRNSLAQRVSAGNTCNIDQAPEGRKQPTFANSPTSNPSQNLPKRKCLPWRPFHLASANQVHMDVKHGLARLRSHVEHRAVPILNAPLAPDLRGNQMKAPNQLSVFFLRFLQPPYMLLGDHQNMRGRLRVDVLEGKTMLVFVDFLGRNLALNNSTKQAVGHWKSVLSSQRPATSYKLPATPHQSSLTRYAAPCFVSVACINASARWRSSFRTRTRTHQVPTGLAISATLAVR